ncbi:uncharacterized protein L3040_004799 [Drepanopeziza brunnea f. sp. 'multigermtubi']|uniref:uncharacterized protein n=1 Tax=Drepanopeziza brunnea f. sp. 'multigermtubi' TaxID=698441 RepID=UPI0023991B94|nr:hypothetical protein L3040_004799 [Drepanopeziza brunnea f. sp. 'multigermtubi']
MTESALLDIYRKRRPSGQILTLAKLQSFLGYMHYTGQLYRYTDRKSRSGRVLLPRIDNGWGEISLQQEYDALYKNPEPYFAQIRSLMNQPDVKAALQKANSFAPIKYESGLYDVLAPFLFLGSSWPWGGKVAVTRHRFHLFLRWCDQARDQLELRRDGLVSMLDEK